MAQIQVSNRHRGERMEGYGLLTVGVFTTCHSKLDLHIPAHFIGFTNLEPGQVVQACNPAAQETNAQSQVQDLAQQLNKTPLQNKRT